MDTAFPFALVGLLTLLAYLGIMIALHLRPTGYDPVHHAVSDYGVGPYRQWFRVALWVSSIGTLALAAGLAITPGTPELAGKDLLFLALIPIMRVGMTLFPTDLEGRKLTRIGLRHYLFAIAAFTFTYLAISDLTADLDLIHPWLSVKGILVALRVTVPITLALVVVTMFPPLRRVFGIFERLFLLSTNLWFIVIAAGLLRKTM
jgi:hypothetical protein